MEVDEIHCKFPRISNGDGKLAHGHKMDDGEEEDGENKRGVAAAAALRGGAVDLGGGLGRFYGWPSSRIVRVSRASGGKDRHSKVLTSKGLRDRRVRLSVNTAIQFYDLQDRLGYDQPSKAVEWLLKAAAASIDELPPMNSPFPDTPKQLSDEKRSSTAGSDQFGFDSAEVDMDGGGGAAAGEQNFSHPQVTKSSAACSSTSETSKGSGLSLSRSESRIKARERAKGRVAEKEKEKENESSHVAGSMNPISQTTSFTELLSGGMNNGAGDGNNTNESNFFLKSSPRHWSSTPMDYFTSGLLGQTSARSGQMHMTGGNPFTSPLFSVSTDHHHHHHSELQQFSFVSDMSNNHNHDHHHNGDYNLNFSISSSSANSSGLVGYNRGTLQSNSSPPQSSSTSLLPHHHHHHQLQRFNSDGSPQGFYIGTAAPVENHHQFQSGYDARLQLCYGGRQSAGQKGKGKN